MDIHKYLISYKSSIKDALLALNEISSLGLTLFVQNSEDKIVGAITDGDIRRKLSDNGELTDSVTTAMKSNFSSFSMDDVDTVSKFKEFKAKGIRVIPVLDKQGHLEKVIDLNVIKSLIPVDAVLMAGGKGERLKPLTEKTPKPLLTVGDKAIIDHNIDRLISYGVKNISVTVNYLKEQIEKHFAEPHNGVQVLTYREPKFLGTIGSIKFVQNFKHDVVLLMNSDVFTNIDYEDFFLHFQQHEAEMSVAAIPYNVKVPYGILDLNGSNIQGFIEKPTYNYYANAGIYLIKKSALAEIPDDTFFNATDLIEKLISQGKKVVRFPLNGTWIDIGNPQEYQKANDIVKYLK